MRLPDNDCDLNCNRCEWEYEPELCIELIFDDMEEILNTTGGK